MPQDGIPLQEEMQDRLWRTSLELCADEETTRSAQRYTTT
jgi:hypothetical protein